VLGTQLHSEEAAVKRKGIPALRELMVTHKLRCYGRNIQGLQKSLMGKRGQRGEDDRHRKSFSK
jgi:hypothetical protein